MSTLPSAHDYSRVIITAMKDEAPYMIEWLSYHISIGFTHFVILTNDCSDGTDKIARHYEKRGIVTHFNNKEPHPKGIQKTGYSRAQRLEAIQESDWLIALDVDEYFRIDVGNGHLDDLFEAIGNNVLAVSLMWEMYGNNGVSQLEDKFVTHQFTKSSTRRQANPYHIRGLKTLHQPQYFERIGTHCPLELLEDTPPDLLWIDGDGVPLPDMLTEQKWLAFNNAQNFGLTLGRINHYAIRSLDALLIKLNRGFVNRANAGVRGENSASEYWRLFNWNIVENNNIFRRSARHQEMYHVMMEDSKIARFHSKGFDWHIETIKRLRNEESWVKESEAELAALGNQSSIEQTDLSTFINPVPDWDFPAKKFQRAFQSSILDPKYLTHLNDL